MTDRRAWLAAVKAGKAYKKEATSEVSLLPDAVPFWIAFNDLGSQRQIGPNGPQPLSVADIRAYGEMSLLPTGDLMEFFEIIRDLDSSWLTYKYAEITKKREEEEKRRGAGNVR